jgi:hypothetical protein
MTLCQEELCRVMNHKSAADIMQLALWSSMLHSLPLCRPRCTAQCYIACSQEVPEHRELCAMCMHACRAHLQSVAYCVWNPLLGLYISGYSSFGLAAPELYVASDAAGVAVVEE